MHILHISFKCASFSFFVTRVFRPNIFWKHCIFTLSVFLLFCLIFLKRRTDLCWFRFHFKSITQFPAGVADAEATFLYKSSLGFLIFFWPITLNLEIELISSLIKEAALSNSIFYLPVAIEPWLSNFSISGTWLPRLLGYVTYPLVVFRSFSQSLSFFFIMLWTILFILCIFFLFVASVL